MYQFFVEDAQAGAGQVRIVGTDVNHIKNVLRMKRGERVRISSAGGKNYLCGIAAFEEDAVLLDILESDIGDTELPAKIYLFQGIPKGERMETVIEKAVELGVHEIIPVAMRYCVVKLDEKKAKAKTARWQGIAEAAAKQSKRGIVPRVREVMGYQEALECAKDMDIKLVPYEMEDMLDGAVGMAGTRQMIERLEPGQSVAVFIGPEGGFEEGEIQSAISCGMTPITLGRRILRTETAGMTVMAWIMYRLEQ